MGPPLLQELVAPANLVLRVEDRHRNDCLDAVALNQVGEAMRIPVQ